MIEIFFAIAPLCESCDPVSLLPPPGDLSHIGPAGPAGSLALSSRSADPSFPPPLLTFGRGNRARWPGTAPRRVVPCVSDTSDRLFERAVAADQGMMSCVIAYHNLRTLFPVAGFAADWLPCIQGPSRGAASIHACQQNSQRKS